jgi:hypothetical protein
MALAVEALYSDCQNTVIHDVFRFWSGEDDKFDVCSLEGIGVFENLRTLDLSTRGALTDLTPLQALPRLESLSLNQQVLPPLAPLLGCCALKSVWLRGNTEDGATLEALSRRGVKVR